MACRDVNVLVAVGMLLGDAHESDVLNDCVRLTCPDCDQEMWMTPERLEIAMATGAVLACPPCTRDMLAEYETISLVPTTQKCARQIVKIHKLFN